jgi:gliding motility-associatede transport system auxiliary component
MEVNAKSSPTLETPPPGAPPARPSGEPKFQPTSSWVAALGLIGVFLLASMFVLYAAQESWTTWNWATGVAGVACFVGWIYLDRTHVATLVRSRKTAIAANVVIMSVLAIVLWGFANTINQRHYKRWDLTKGGNFTISDSTKNILRSLDKDVKITSLLPSGETGDVSVDQINDFLEEYKASSSRISLEVFDPDLNPKKATEIASRLKLSRDDLASGSVFFECGDRSKRVTLDDIIERPQQNPYNPTPDRSAKFKGEEAFTSAILSVVEDKQATVYFVTGHEEAKTDDFRGEVGAGAVARYLQRQNIKVADLPIDTGKDVPPDCDVLVVDRPRKPYSQAEQAVLKRYLDKGGKLFALLDAPVDPGADSGLGGLLADYGVEVGTNLVIETDPRHVLLTITWPVVDSFGTHPITEQMKNVRILMPESRSIDPAGDTKGYDVTTLARTTENSWAETDIASLLKEDAEQPTLDPTVDKKGPVSLAVAVSKKSEGKGGLRMVVTGSAAFAGNQFVGQLSNLDFFMNCINWLQSRENRISIGAKSLDVPTVTLTLEQSSRLFWFAIAVLPGLSLVLAGIVYVKRRR